MPKERWVMGFIANVTNFPAVQKFCKSVKIWQSYREFKGGNFFWETVYNCASEHEILAILHISADVWDREL